MFLFEGELDLRWAFKAIVSGGSMVRGIKFVFLEWNKCIEDDPSAGLPVRQTQKAIKNLRIINLEIKDPKTGENNSANLLQNSVGMDENPQLYDRFEKFTNLHLKFLIFADE